jgi:hypothetical protein
MANDVAKQAGYLFEPREFEDCNGGSTRRGPRRESGEGLKGTCPRFSAVGLSLPSRVLGLASALATSSPASKNTLSVFLTCRVTT